MNSIIEVLKTFDNADHRSFGKFVSSPYFNTNDRVTLLYELIKNTKPDYTGPSLEKEELFSKLYNSKKFEAKTFRYLVSELNKLLERFLLQKNIEKGRLHNKRMTAVEIMERRLPKRSKRLFAEIYDEITEVPLCDDLYFRFEFDLLAAYRSNLMILNDKSIRNLKRDTESLIYYVISSLIHVYNALMIEKMTYNGEVNSSPELNFIESLDIKNLLAYYDKPVKNLKNLSGGEKVNIAMCISLHLAATLNDLSDEEHLRKAVDLVDKHWEIYSRDEQFNIYNILSTCCVLKTNFVDSNKYKKLFLDVKKSSLGKGLYAYRDNYLTVSNYRSIFGTALNLGEIDWARQFSNEYLDKIYPDYRDELKYYTLAELDFVEGKYEDALSHLSNVRFKYEALKRFVKNLMLKIYYELNYIEEALSLIDTYKHYISKNKKISDVSRIPNNNFLMFYKDLLRFKIKPDEFDLFMLKKRIEEAGNVSSKDWLLKKLDEFEIKKPA